MQWKYAKRSLYTHAAFNQTEGKKMKISGLLVLKQPNTINGKDPPSITILQGGKNMPVFKNSINISWGKLIYLCICILIYHC